MSSLLMLGILVTLGALSVHAVGLVTSVLGDDSRALALARTSEAAAAGLEWGRERVARAGGPLCTAVQSINALPGALAPYTVTVRCTATAVAEAGIAARYLVTATACNETAAGTCPGPVNPGPDYVQRTVQFVLHR